jgi:hypothetical protein
VAYYIHWNINFWRSKFKKVKNLEILEPREWNKIILIDIPFGDYKEINSPY